VDLVPTLRMIKKSLPLTDVEKQSMNGCTDKDWISRPILGNYLAFDGKLLHDCK
jgi:hypothetical protein